MKTLIFKILFNFIIILSINSCDIIDKAVYLGSDEVKFVKNVWTSIGEEEIMIIKIEPLKKNIFKFKVTIIDSDKEVEESTFQTIISKKFNMFLVNVDMSTKGNNSQSQNENIQGYLLFGGFIVQNKFYVVSADMKSFSEIFKDQIQYERIKSNNLCNKDELDKSNCFLTGNDILFQNKYILDDSKSYQDKLMKHFYEIFDFEEAIVFQ